MRTTQHSQRSVEYTGGLIVLKESHRLEICEFYFKLNVAQNRFEDLDFDGSLYHSGEDATFDKV